MRQALTAGMADPRPRATWRTRPWAGRVASRSVILLAVTILPCAAAAQGDGQPFRVGFSSTMFTDVNESDAKAAVKVWAQTIARERGIETDPDPCILTGMTELASALRNKQVDMVALTDGGIPGAEPGCSAHLAFSWGMSAGAWKRSISCWRIATAASRAWRT